MKTFLTDDATSHLESRYETLSVLLTGASWGPPLDADERAEARACLDDLLEAVGVHEAVLDLSFRDLQDRVEALERELTTH